MLTAQRQFEMDARQEDAESKIQACKQALETEATHEIYEKMGNTLADFQTWPTWTMESTEASDIQIYTLSMKVVFKP